MRTPAFTEAMRIREGMRSISDDDDGNARAHAMIELVGDHDGGVAQDILELYAETLRDPDPRRVMRAILIAFLAGTLRERDQAAS